MYPFKTVEAGATVNDSIVWESRGARSLFGRDGVVGLANVDITPELATKVAMAYGSMLKKGTRVITSRDSSRSARMLKRAMMAGLNAAGVDVEDLEVASVPVTRFIVRRPSSAGGVTIRLVHDDPQSVIIRFFDDHGLDITEDAQRKIERLFNREDFRRVFPGEIGDIGFAPRALEHYATALESTVDVERIRDAAVQGGHRLRLRLDLVRHAQRAGQAGPRGAGRQPVRVHRRAAAAPTSTSTPCGWPTWCGRRARTWARCSIPTASGCTLIDDEGHVLTDDEALLALLSLLPGKLAGDKVALPVSATHLAGDIVARARRRGRGAPSSATRP